MATAATIDVELRSNITRYRSGMIEASRLANQHLGQVRKEAASTASSLQAMNRAAAGFIGFQSVRAGISSLIAAQKSIQQIHYGLQGATGSAATAERAYAFVSQTAKELGLNLETSAKSFVRLTASASASNIPMRQQQELFKELARSSTVMHLSSEETDRAITALSQSFSKGKFQAEELRQQLGEAIPGVMPRFMAAVAEMNKGTALAGVSFDELLQKGMLSTQQYLPAMISALRQTGSGAEAASKSLTAELNRLSTAWYDLRVEASNGIFSDAAITSVRFMAENLDRVAGAATLAAGVVAGRLIGMGAGRAYGMAAEPIRTRLSDNQQIRETAQLAQERAREAAAQVNQTRASMLQTAAWRAQSAQGVEVARQQMAVAFASNEAAQATLKHQQGTLALSANFRAQRDATIAAEAAQRRLAMAQANLNAAQASGNLAAQRDIALKGQLIAAQEAAAIATNNLAAARVREAAASRAASLRAMAGSAARTVGTGLLGLAGGPWGAAAIAIGALGYAYVGMQRKAEDARREFQEQVKSLDLLSYSIQDVIERSKRMDGVSLREMADAWNRSGVEIRKNEQDLARLQERVDYFQERIRIGQTSTRDGAGLGLAADYRSLEQAQQQLAKLRGELEPTRERFMRLQGELQKALPADVFEKLKVAALELNDVELTRLLAQLDEAKLRGYNAADAIRAIGTAASKDLYARQVDQLKREQGEYTAWLADQGKAYREAFQVPTAQQAFELLSPAQRKEFQDRARAVKSLIDAEKDWKEQDKTNKASTREGISLAKEQENQYQSAIDRINRQIALDREEMLLNDDMTAAQRLQVVVTNEMASAKSKLSDVEQQRVRTLLDEAVAVGKALAARDAEKKAAEELLRLQKQLNEAARTQQASNESDLFSIGRGQEAAEQLRRQVDLQREYQRQVEDLNLRAEAGKYSKYSYDQQLEELRFYHAIALESEANYQRRRASMQGDWTNGAMRAWDDFSSHAADRASQMESAITNMLSSGEDMWIQWAKTGKVESSSLRDAIMADLAKIAYQQALVGLVTGLGQAFGPRITGFAAGGYTGPGDVLQPAGVVHKGEVVWSQRDVAKAGGVGAVEAMRLGRRGYAEGGAVGVRVPVGSSGGLQVIINNNAPTRVEARQEQQRQPDGSTMERLVIDIFANDLANGGRSMSAIKSRLDLRERV